MFLPRYSTPQGFRIHRRNYFGCTPRDTSTSIMYARERRARARRARSLLTGGRRVGASQAMCRMHSRGGDGCTARRRPGSRSSACLGRKEKRRGAWGAPGARVPERRGNLFAQLSSPSRCALWWRQRLARAAPRPALYYLPGISCGPLVHRGGGLVRAASQQAGPEPGHCRGRGRTLLPAPCVCWGSWAIVCVPVSASLSVVEGPYGAEHERWHCVLCRMFGSQFVQKTTMLWGDDKKKVVKKGNEWVSCASWGAH